MEEAKQELHRIINDREMKDSLLLVFANKQDLDNGNNNLDPFPSLSTYSSSFCSFFVFFVSPLLSHPLYRSSPANPLPSLSF